MDFMLANFIFGNGEYFTRDVWEKKSPGAQGARRDNTGVAAAAEEPRKPQKQQQQRQVSEPPVQQKHHARIRTQEDEEKQKLQLQGGRRPSRLAPEFDGIDCFESFIFY